MPSVDTRAILEPVTPDAPCGIDLEDGNKYDPAFAELERLAVGKPEQQIGNTIIPAETPDWKIVQRKSTDLLARSKDLRVATHLARALLHTDGWVGFAHGLEVLQGLVEQYWDGMYPRLDPEDGNDPTMRVNILMSVTDSAMVSTVRSTPLVVSRTLGRFSLKDLELASGDAAAAETSGDPSGAMASIEAAAVDADLGVLQQTTSAVQACMAALAALETAIAARVDSADSLTFTRLTGSLRKAETFLAVRLAQRAPHEKGVGGEMNGTSNGTPNGTSHGASNGTGEGADRTGAAPASWAGGIRSRDDVLRALNAISIYYETNEPSSPIPIFVTRCKRLVTMGFVDIVRDLVPDALPQVDVLRGRVE